MTRSQKIVLVGLGVLLALFVVVLLYGGTQPGCEGATPRSGPPCKAGSGMQLLGKLTSPLARGVKLPQKRYEVVPGGQAVATIDAASDDMRTLRLRLVEGGGAQVGLRNRTPDTGERADQAEPTKNPIPYDAEDRDKQRVRLFVVTPAGAMLTMKCIAAPRCVFAAE